MARSRTRARLLWLMAGVFPVFLALPAYGQLQRGIAFSSDSANVAVCGEHVRVYSVADGTLVAEFNNQPAGSIAFSPKTPSLLAAGGADGAVRLFHVDTKKGVRELQGLDGEVSSVAFSADGGHLAGTSKGRLRLWEVATGKVVQFLDDGKVGITGVSFSGDGRKVAFCRNLDQQASRVDIYDAATWKPVAGIRLAAKEQKNSPHGKATTFGTATAFVAGESRVLVAGGVCVPVSKAESAPYDFGCRPTGLVWTADIDAKEAKLLIEPRPGYIQSVSVSADGKRFAMGADNPAVMGKHVIEMREVGTGKVFWQTRGEVYEPLVVVSPDGKLVASCRLGIHIWKADTGELVCSIPARR